MSIICESLSTPVKYECDVCVAGGGVAGVAAALAAARRGAEVILLDRGFMLGGLATAGIVTIYLPLCDGSGNQVAFGLAEELLRLSIEYGYEDRYPEAWLDGGDYESRKSGKRFEVQFNAQLFAISCERVLREAGVRILYGAVATRTTVEGGKITNVIIEGKSGREAIAIRKSVVDCTGDADICRLAGAECMLFGQGNVLAAWYYGYGNRSFELNMCGFCDIPDEDKIPGQQIPMLNNRRFVGLETEELSEMMQMSHSSLMNNLLKRREEIPDLLPVTMATIPQIRMTRGIKGLSIMDTTDDRRRYPDSVGTFSNWRKRGPIYELPLSALYNKDIKNLLAAGRCFGATDAMWDITRVIPVCAVSGEAAGACAAMTDDVANVDIGALQDYLRTQGVKIHIDELELH